MQILLDEDVLDVIGEQQSQYISKPSDWTQGVIDIFDGKPSLAGDFLPWTKTHNLFAFRPGEVTIWGGFNGHGKSQVLGQVCAWNLQKKWLIASMEMNPESTMARMVRQTAGCKDVAHRFINKFMGWTDNRLWIYDQTDTVASERILGVVLYAAKKLGVNHVVIDSLMKCGFRGGKDKIACDQVAFVDRLCWAAKTNNIHIHLVHHMRKGEGNTSEFQCPGKHDFRGQGELVDLVHNAIVCHRNKGKEDIMSGNNEVKKTKVRSMPDQLLNIVKQRNGEWEGKINLWYHPDSFQYLPTQSRQAMSYNLINA